MEWIVIRKLHEANIEPQLYAHALGLFSYFIVANLKYYHLSLTTFDTRLEVQSNVGAFRLRTL